MTGRRTAKHVSRFEVHRSFNFPFIFIGIRLVCMYVLALGFRIWAWLDFDLFFQPILQLAEGYTMGNEITSPILRVTLCDNLILIPNHIAFRDYIEIEAGVSWNLSATSK